MYNKFVGMISVNETSIPFEVIMGNGGVTVA